MTILTTKRLAGLIAANTSWRGVMRGIPVRASPAARHKLIETAEALGLDYSHFNHGQAWSGGLTADRDPRLAKRRRAGLTIKGT